MYRGLHSKLILILFIFIIAVMSVVGVIMLLSVSAFFTADFTSQVSDVITPDVSARLSAVFDDTSLSGSDAAEQQKAILQPYFGQLGIGTYRNIYILGASGAMLAGTNAELGLMLQRTPNIYSAMGGQLGAGTQPTASYMDWAAPVLRPDGSVGSIIYVKDTKEQVGRLSWVIFTIILQALIIGLAIAVILSFFLARAITSPIQNLTNTAQRLAKGDFEALEDTDPHPAPRDEIGTLTRTFGNMAGQLKDTLDTVSGEREKLSTIFLYLTDGVLAFASDGSLVNINKTACAMLDLDVGQDGGYVIKGSDESASVPVTLRSFRELLGLGELHTRFEDSDASGASMDYHDIQYGKYSFDIQAGKLNFRDAGELQEGVLVVIHDATGRYELEQARREFVANVSHELRTPLTSILSAAETLADDKNMAEQWRDRLLEIIKDESVRMDRIVRDLLELSRLDNNKMQWKFAPVDTAELITRICMSMQMLCIEHSHMLITDIPDALPQIYADRGRIEQVLVNIINNAIKYTPNGGRIEVSARTAPDGEFKQLSGEAVVIRVRDNGIGIPKSDLPFIFDRFYRVEKARSSQTGGTGLGLAIAQEIVRAHNGLLTAESEPEKGTTMTVALPAAGMRGEDGDGIENEE